MYDNSLNELPFILSVQEVANCLRISRSKAYELIHQNDFPSLSVGRRIVVPRHLFVEWINKSSLSKSV